MIYDFFYLITNDADVSDMMTILCVFFIIGFIVLSPLFFSSFRNARFIDKMNKKSKKKQSNSFDVQFAKLIGNAGKQDEVSECRKQIAELKAELERLKKSK